MENCKTIRSDGDGNSPMHAVNTDYNALLREYHFRLYTREVCI